MLHGCHDSFWLLVGVSPHGLSAEVLASVQNLDGVVAFLIFFTLLVLGLLYNACSGPRRSNDEVITHHASSVYAIE